MKASIEIVHASAATLEHVRELWREYWESFGLPRDFQDFEAECEGLPGAYAPPTGRLLLARSVVDEAKPLADARGSESANAQSRDREGAVDNAVFAGTIALRRLNAHACEAKRLYVRPRFRGSGIGGSLLERLIREAREIGYGEMYADTLPSMASALGMYRTIGFTEIGPYTANPTPGAIFLRLDLASRAL